MNLDWHEFKIVDIAEDKPNALAMGPFGSNITKDNFVEIGVPVIRGGNISQGRFYPFGFVFLTDEKADKLRASNALPGDLVFTHRGTLGQVGIIPKGLYPRYVVSQSQMKFSCNRNKASPLFMFYYFSSLGKTELLKHKSGSGVPAIASPLTTLKNLRIKIPPLPAQHKIASILSAYDDLIENNTRRMSILEEMAQMIYREWFVKFRFPGHEKVKMVDSPLGKIPEGWEVGSLGDLVKVKSGFAFKSKDFSDQGNPVIKIRNIGNNTIDLNNCDCIGDEIAQKASKFLLKEGDLLIALTGAKVGKAGVMPKIKESYYLNQRVGIFKYLPKINLMPYLCILLTSNNIQHKIVQLARGAAQPNISPSHMESIQVIIPDENVLTEFVKINEPLFTFKSTLLAKSDQLRITRDLLLPKLISGELDVSDLDLEILENDEPELQVSAGGMK